ncbi:TPA: pyridoxamine 5'-phosphate oxidase family protein [Streptococcus agalactiae]|nr:pyridoxamine 5'-phosphate oxidase family protein [Streptococcus agalactiae]
MLNHKFLQVLKYEGVVSITSWIELAPHVTNTWNSYLTITDDQRILAPAAGMTHLENDLNNNSKIIMTLGSREVEGRDGYQGTGFKIEGTAKLLEAGSDFEIVKEKYPFLRKVLEVTPINVIQLL